MIKKCIVFGITFISLFFIFQISTSMLLTFFYTPDVNAAWKMAGNTSEEVILTNEPSFIITAFFLILAISISYFITTKILYKQKSAS